MVAEDILDLKRAAAPQAAVCDLESEERSGLTEK